MPRCIKMALVHDLAESIVGDLLPNEVTKEEKYRREKVQACGSLLFVAHLLDIAGSNGSYQDTSSRNGKWYDTITYTMQGSGNGRQYHWYDALVARRHAHVHSWRLPRCASSCEPARCYRNEREVFIMLSHKTSPVNCTRKLLYLCGYIKNSAL